MNRNEKILAGGLLGTLLVGMFSDRLLDLLPFTTGPIQSQVASANAKLLELQTTIREAEVRHQELAAFRRLSLPADPASANVRYQEFLVRALESCGVVNPIVTAASPIAVEDIGYRLHFSVQSTATAAAIGKFMDLFYEAEVLHRFHFVNVGQSGNADSPEHSFALGIDVLTFRGDDQRSPDLEPTGKGKLLAHRLAKRDIFQRPRPPEPSSLQQGFQSLVNAFSQIPIPPQLADSASSEIPVGVEVQVVEEPTAAPPAASDTIRFVGVIEQANRKRALFFDTRTRSQLLVNENESLDELGIDAKVLRIDRDILEIRWESKNQRLELGQKIADAKPGS